MQYNGNGNHENGNQSLHSLLQPYGIPEADTEVETEVETQPDFDSFFHTTYINFARTRRITDKSQILKCLEQAIDEFEGTPKPESSLDEVDRLMEKFDIQLLPSDTFSRSTRAKAHRDTESVSEPEPEPEPEKSVEDDLDLMGAILRYQEAGNDLYSCYIPYPAEQKLDTIDKRVCDRFYRKASANTDLKTGRCNLKWSRADWTDFLGISRATWYRLEKEMLASELIAYHCEERGWKKKVFFILPDVADWYLNVQKKSPHKHKDFDVSLTNETGSLTNETGSLTNETGSLTHETVSA